MNVHAAQGVENSVFIYIYIYSRVYILPFARSKVVANPLRACLGVFLT